MTAEWLTLTPAQYHAAVAPGEVPPLSHSLAVELLNNSPLHARRKWLARAAPDPKSEEAVEKRRAMEHGTLVHAALLGEQDDRILQCPFDNWLTKAAKAAKAEAREAGKVPVLRKHVETARSLAEKLRPRLRERGIDLSAGPKRYNEQAITWTEESDAGPVQCRAMYDHVDLTRPVVIDLKITASAHPEKIRRRVLDFGYDVQAAAYVSALEHMNPALAGRVPFVLAFAEISTAEVVLVPFHEAGLSFGRQRWARAVRTWGRCVAENHWPGYPAEVPWSPTEWQYLDEMRRGQESDELAAMAAPRRADSPSEPPEGDEDDNGTEEDDSPF